MGILGKSKWKLDKNDSDYIIAEEVALKQIKSFLQYYKIDVDSWDKGEDVLNKLLDFCRMGLIEFKVTDGKAQIRQVLYKNRENKIVSKENDFFYNSISGEDKAAIDGYGETERMKMMYALLGSMSGQGEDIIKKLKDFDLSVVECIGGLFLQI